MYLCGVVDPHESLVAGDHGDQVGQGAHRVVGRLRLVLTLTNQHQAVKQGIQQSIKDLNNQEIKKSRNQGMN